MRVRDCELHAGKAAVLQARAEAGPELDVLGFPDLNTEDLTFSSAVTPVAIMTARDST